MSKVKIGSAKHDENGNGRGGEPGRAGRGQGPAGKRGKER